MGTEVGIIKVLGENRAVDVKIELSILIFTSEFTFQDRKWTVEFLPPV